MAFVDRQQWVLPRIFIYNLNFSHIPLLSFALYYPYNFIGFVFIRMIMLSISLLSIY